MRCVHCGEWNQGYMVFFKGPRGIQVVRNVVSASSDEGHLEREARVLLEKNWNPDEFGCTVWDLTFDHVRPITQEEASGPSRYSRPAS